LTQRFYNECKQYVDSTPSFYGLSKLYRLKKSREVLFGLLVLHGSSKKEFIQFKDYFDDKENSRYGTSFCSKVYNRSLLDKYTYKDL